MRVGAGPLDQLVGHRLQPREIHVAALLRLKLEAAGVAQSLDRRRPKDADDGPFDLLIAKLLDLRGDDRVVFLRRPLLERLQAEEHRRQVGAVGGREKRFPGDANGVGHAGDGAGNFVDFGQDFIGPLHRGAVRQLDVDEQIALILHGDEAGRRARHPPPGQPEQTEVDHQNNHAQAQHLPDRPAVGRRDAIEEAVETPEEPAQHGIDGSDKEPACHEASQQAGREPGSPVFPELQRSLAIPPGRRR